MNYTPPESAYASVTPRLLTPFVVIGFVLLLSISATYFMGRLVIEGHREVSAKQEASDRLRIVVSTIQAAETGQRGYLLTDKERYLTAYTEAKARFEADINSLKSFQVKDISQLKSLANAKMLELDQTISIRRTDGLNAAMNVVNSDEGQSTMEAIRNLADQMIHQADADLNEILRRVDHLGTARTSVFALATLMSLLFLWWAYSRIKETAAASDAATTRYLQQKEILSVALTSIGDGIIMTDNHAKVTLMNKVAEDLTGWSMAEASGKDCVEVFKIINEDSRNTVESPVDKVLRSGLIVGLANHTLLIRRDGAEISIDDSGAPIRDEAGQIHGVVLVFRDFSGHRENETSLRKAKEEAETANAAKDNFLATLSHELRTPLTPVVTTLAGWESEENLSASMRAEVQMMRRNIELEARLIDDLLDLTRIVKGKLPLNLETADIHDLLGSVTEMYHSEITGKRLHFSMLLSAESHFALVDTSRLQQVFLNILKNSTKFTLEGGNIEVQTVDVGGQIAISFKDDGIGMSQDTQNRLFRPFEQGSEETVRRYGGLGLGMSISKALVEALGGQISASSEGLGAGAIFTVTLPCVKKPNRPLKPSQPQGLKGTRSLKILMVEDHQDTARALTSLLTRAGHVVTGANSVAQATEFLKNINFDLLLCDIGLPDGTGIDVIKFLRKYHNTPAIALTGFGMEEDVQECKEAGFNAHLTKPLNLQRLAEAIHAVTDES